MHILPGRVRLRFEELKNNPPLADRLSYQLQREQGIRNVSINVRTGSCLVLFDATLRAPDIIKGIHRQLKKAASSPRYRSTQRYPPQLNKDNKLQRVMTGGAILTLFWGLPGIGKNMPLPITSAALITTGYPIFKSGLTYFKKHKKPNYEFMVSTLSILSTLKGKGTLGILALWLSNLSEYLQQLTFKTASRSFSNILIKKGNRVALLKNGKIQHILPGDVMPGDSVVFRAGDCIPLEGEVISGRAQVGLTEKLVPGNFTQAGLVLEKGQITVKVHRVVEDTSLARLADILDDAIENPLEGSDLALHYSERLLPITFLTTLLVYGFTRDLQRAIPVLLAGAPGPAGLAAPTALSASTGLAAGMGIAVQDNAALALLSHIDVVLFQDEGLSQQSDELHSTLRKLTEEGYHIEDFDPDEIDEPNPGNHLLEGHALTATPEATVNKIHHKGLRVAWVSGPEHPLFVENADINIMFLNGNERQVAPAQILCYRKDPRQIYRLIMLSNKTMQTVKENVFLVQGLNLLGQILGALGIIGSLPAIGLNLLTTLAVVCHSGHSLIGIGNKNYMPFQAKGTIEGLSVGKGKCLFISKETRSREF